MMDILNELINLYDSEQTSRNRQIEDDEEGESVFEYDPEDNPFRKMVNCYKLALQNHQFEKTTDTGENLDSVVRYKLTFEEGFSIFAYTHYYISTGVNGSGNLTYKDWSLYAEQLENALNKLPPYSGNILYHDSHNDDLPFYKKNYEKIITIEQFLSTHKEKGRWSDEETGTHVIIKSLESESKSRDISKCAFNHDEHEVLFIKGSKFVVEGIDENKRIIFLTEVG